MLRHLTLLVLVACSSKSEPPAPTTALGFVPVELASQLAGAQAVIAVNAERSDLGPLSEGLPPEFDCARDLLHSIGVAVLVIGRQASELRAYATKLPERETRACLDALIPLMGGSTGTGESESYEVRIGENSFSLAWKAGIVTARPLGAVAVRGGPPAPEMRALVEHVPATASVFYLGTGNPARKLKSVSGWGHVADDTVHMHVRVEGTERGVVRPWLQGFIDSFNGAAEAKQIPVDYRWFEGTLDEPVGTIAGRIPAAVFRASAQRW